MSDSLQPHRLQHARLLCPSSTPGAYSNFIESVMPSNHLILCRTLSSCLQSFSASVSFQMSEFFASDGQSIGVSASASVLPMNIQDWFPFDWFDLLAVQGTLKSFLQYHGRWRGHGGEFWQSMVHWRREWQTTSVFLSWEPHELIIIGSQTNSALRCCPFSSCHQTFPASGAFLMSQFFASDGQSIGVSSSALVLPMNIQDWFPLGWTGWISLLSKGLSRVFSNTTIQKHHFFSAQLSL